MKYRICAQIKFQESESESIFKKYFQKFIKQEQYDTGLLERKSLETSHRREKIILQGIVALITGTYPVFYFEEYKVLNEKGEECARGLILPLDQNNGYRSSFISHDHNEFDATQIYKRALKNSDLMGILVLFSRKLEDCERLGWATMNTIYEIIKGEMKTDDQKAKVFTELANTARDPFFEIRHGRVLKPEEKHNFKILSGIGTGFFDAPTHVHHLWAFSFIRDLVIQWLSIKKSFKITIKRSEFNINKVIVVPKGKDFHWSDPVKKYEQYIETLTYLPNGVFVAKK